MGIKSTCENHKEARSGVQTIGETVAEDYRAAAVFKSYGIDFCCNGDRSVQEACIAKGISAEEVMDTILEVTSSEVGKGSEDFNSWPLDLLIDYIEKRHHVYVEKAITELKPYLKKVAKIHGTDHPELIEIQELFLASADDLVQHMKKEELVLFPFIRRMVASESENRSVPIPNFGSVENPVNRMKDEHDNEGNRFRSISALSAGYALPEGACNSYRVTYSLLKEFEDDLHRHIHLENNILFPKAIELEKRLRDKA